MTDRDKQSLVAAIDPAAALGLLTRLPVPVDGAAAGKRSAAAAWAYPLAGLVVGVLVALIGAMSLWLGLSPAIAATLVLASSVILTGAMHEDGLADTADGLWGGWDRARRLEIMKDSRIGAYGVIALILSLLLRWQALSLIIAAGLMWPALIAAAMISRSAMVLNMWLLPPARDTGLSHAVGRPATGTVQIAAVFACLGGLLLGVWVIALMIVATFAALIVGQIAKAKIGGQTGDILGASQQVVDIAILLAITALI